ncbi:MAG TPA: hypothetical protein VNX21_02690 [Candidatus Thermoplasmatota archaeon]|nr:hypothetical protein [Candidatus Thermoplasmatota archaeon]
MKTTLTLAALLALPLAGYAAAQPDPLPLTQCVDEPPVCYDVDPDEGCVTTTGPVALHECAPAVETAPDSRCVRFGNDPCAVVVECVTLTSPVGASSCTVVCVGDYAPAGFRCAANTAPTLAFRRCGGPDAWSFWVNDARTQCFGLVLP